MYSRRISDGKIHFEIDLGAPIESPPTLAKGRLFIHLRNHKIFALDANTGKILWSYKRTITHNPTLQGVSQPVVFKNKIIVGFADGYLIALSLHRGIILWERELVQGEKFLDLDITPRILNKKIYLSILNAPMAIISPRDGKILKRLPYHLSAPVLALKNKNFVFATDHGQLILLDRDYKRLKSKKFTNQAITGVYTWRGFIIAHALDGKVFIFDQNNFSIVDTIHLGHKYSQVSKEIALDQDTLALVSTRGRLYVFHQGE